MELIRTSHRRKGWSDIGYHYVIDRAGRLWEARPINYQGAHVRDNNEHNIGVMCMGNFDLQQPSEAQLTTLARTVQQIRQYYRVSESRIYTHQEINPTACPGRNMQPRVVTMRSRRMFA
jgi:N-acetyl-anhydromuramyl-L-alanine amidase AmpD